MIKKGQTVECLTAEGKLKTFTVIKVGRKYVYLSNPCASEEDWKAEKTVMQYPHLFGPPTVIKCN